MRHTDYSEFTTDELFCELENLGAAIYDRGTVEDEKMSEKLDKAFHEGYERALRHTECVEWVKGWNANAHKNRERCRNESAKQFACSLCGCWASNVVEVRNVMVKVKYCPNCGAEVRDE